jgi:hypothetical protein
MLHNRRKVSMSGFALLTLHKITSESRFNAEEGAPERIDLTDINVFCIRAFYARKGNKPGTRITFNDGGGFAVAEPVDYVRSAALAVAKGKPQPRNPFEPAQLAPPAEVLPASQTV